MPDETKEEKPAETPTLSLIDIAKKLHEDIKKENDRHETLLKQEQELEARRLLGGHTDAGYQPPKPAELSPKEYASQVSKGIIPLQ